MNNILAGTTVVRTWWRLWLDYVLTGLVGDPVRIAGAILALFVLYQIWRPKAQPFFTVRKYVVAAVLCEACFFLAQLPLMAQEISLGTQYTVLYVGYLLQFLLAAPPLIVLSLKVWRYTDTVKANVLKWAGVAGVSYLAGIWVNNILRTYLSGITSTVFLNALITLSLSLVFAIAGFITLLKARNKSRSLKLFALALIMVGLHFAVFLIYSAFTNTLGYAILVEIWPVALLGVGFSMLREKMDGY
jgi:hypothetical protein